MRKSWLILVLVACLPLTAGLDCDDIDVADALYFVDALTGPVYGGGYYGGGYYDDSYYDDNYYDDSYYGGYYEDDYYGF